MNAINVKDITMKFGEVTALNHVNVTFESNKIYGLLGRNGAGKSTLLNIITNKIFPTDGVVSVDGEASLENDNALGKIYCMSEKTLYTETVKIKEVFQWSKLFYKDFDEEYAKSLAKIFDLNLNKKIKGLSTGYNSIFKLIIALSVNVPYILLDEPVLGLDANHRELFYKVLLQNYSEHPKTIIISTHLIEEVADLIEQVVIIKQGEVILDKPTEEVLQMGYCVSGSAQEVDNYISDKKTLSVESLGGLKTACLLGTVTKSELPTGLQTTKLDLQKLFIQLTNQL
ncbi:MAG: ABC transporter ATP-binding protein [Oscillospiraceae bacterium]